MTYGPCRNCNAVTVPSNTLCFDCVYPSPQDRQNAYTQMAEHRDRMHKRLRDELAIAALPYALERAPSLFEVNNMADRVRFAAAFAYTIADDMLNEREQKR